MRSRPPFTPRKPCMPSASEIERCLEQLHAESFGWALACCHRDYDDAEEVLQIAYLKILEGKAVFDGRSTFKTWLFAVIRFTAWERFRWKNARRRITAFFTPTESADERIERNETAARLVRALATLATRQREVLELELERKSLNELRRWCERLDPARAHLGRTQLLRALETALLSGERISDLHQRERAERTAPTAGVSVSYLVVDPLSELPSRIETRVDRMLEQGWKEEVRELMRTVPPDAPAWKASGYSVIRAHVEDQVDLRMATFSKSLASCGGVIAGPADVIEFLRIQSRPFMFTASAVPAAVGAALAAVRICRSPEGQELFARVLDNARYLYDGLRGLGYQAIEPTRLPDGSEIVTPVVPVVVGDDWKAVFLWKALYDAGVFVNTALHPAVPPGGALLRTSVMATHDTPTLDHALEAFGAAKRAFEAEHGPLPSGA